MQILISLIIPAYNVENYIEECLQSMMRLPFSKEIIVVNDGSSDGTKAKIEELQKEDSSIKLINQSNKGQSVARNKALSLATGKYFYFVDADDYVYSDVFSEFLNFTINNNLKVGIALFDNQKSNTEIELYYPRMKKIFPIYKIISGLIFIRGALNFQTYGAEVCLYIFEREMCKDLKFPEDMKKHEDDFFIPEALSKADKVGFFNRSVYFRRYRENSVSRGVNNIPSRSIKDISRNIQHYSQRAKGTSDKHARQVFATLAVRSFISILDYSKYETEKKESSYKFFFEIVPFSDAVSIWKLKFLKYFIKNKLRMI